MPLVKVVALLYYELPEVSGFALLACQEGRGRQQAKEHDRVAAEDADAFPLLLQDRIGRDRDRPVEVPKKRQGMDWKGGGENEERERERERGTKRETARERESR